MLSLLTTLVIFPLVMTLLCVGVARRCLAAVDARRQIRRPLGDLTPVRRGPGVARTTTFRGERNAA